MSRREFFKKILLKSYCKTLQTTGSVQKRMLVSKVFIRRGEKRLKMRWEKLKIVINLHLLNESKTCLLPWSMWIITGIYMYLTACCAEISILSVCSPLTFVLLLFNLIIFSSDYFNVFLWRNQNQQRDILMLYLSATQSCTFRNVPFIPSNSSKPS